MKHPMPGILDNTHPGCFYGPNDEYGIVPIMGSSQYMVLGPNDGACVQLKKCRTVDTAKKWIDQRVASLQGGRKRRRRS